MRKAIRACVHVNLFGRLSKDAAFWNKIGAVQTLVTKIIFISRP